MNALHPARSALLDLGFVRRGDRTVLDRRLFAWPFVVTRTFHLDTAPADMLTVILQTSSGAVHGEDRLAQRFHLGPGAAAHLTTQGAASVHRAHTGVTTREAVGITLDEGAFLEYLPEPRILFPGAALDQTIDIDCAPDAAALVCDAFTVHNPDHDGAGFRRLQSTIIGRFGGGEPAAIERLDITGLGRGRAARYTAFGTVLFIAPLPVDVLERLALDLSSALIAIPGLYGAASLLPGNIGISARLAALDLRAVRAGQNCVWIACRRQLYGHPPPSRRKGDGFDAEADAGHWRPALAMAYTIALAPKTGAS